MRPGPIQGDMVHPYLRRRQRAGAGRAIRATAVRRRARAHARRADLPGAGDAARDRRRRLHAGRGRPAAPRDGGVEAQGRARATSSERLIDGMRERGYRARVRRAASTSRSSASANTAFPNRTRRASRCWSTSRPGSSATSRRPSAPRCSTASRWASTRRRSWCRTRAATASRCGRSTSLASDWDCTLERARTARRRCASACGMVKGLSRGRRRAPRRRTRARGLSPSVDELARARATRPPRTRSCLAAAGALAALAGHRRRAHWHVAGVEAPPPLLPEAPDRTRASRCCARRREGEDIVADYAQHSASRCGRHPLALLRPRLARMRLADRRSSLRALPHGAHVRAAGIVIARQRPDTASGVMFVTLEDETGYVNVIVWRDLGERQRRELLGARLMAVYGVGRARRRGGARDRAAAGRPQRAARPAR